MDYALMGMSSEDLSIRRKCHGIFYVFYKMLAVVKGDSAIFYKWFFIIESLRLSIKEKDGKVPLGLVHFVISSMHVSANPLHSEYAFVCDAFCTKTVIKKMRMPLQHRLLMTHFYDIEKYEKLGKDRYDDTKCKYMKNRLISETFDRII